MCTNLWIKFGETFSPHGMNLGPVTNDIMWVEMGYNVGSLNNEQYPTYLGGKRTQD